MMTRTRSRGFTLVELLVAVAIALFLMGGLVSLVFALRRTNVVQTGLSQLQENERLSLSLIGDVVQTSGYFPIKPTGWVTGMPLQTASGELPVVGSFTSSGQAIYGTGTGAGDTLAVRYVVSGSDNVINCSGSATTTAANVTNLFQIATVNGISYLQCVLTTTVIATGTTTVQTINLVPGITNMAVLYGVRTNGGSGTNSVDTYLNGTAVSAGNYWPYVLTAKVTLTFANPLYCAAGACQPGQTSTVAPTVLFGTVIDVMNHT